MSVIFIQANALTDVV